MRTEVTTLMTPFGWTASVTAGQVSLHDEAGVLRASYTAEDTGAKSTRIRQGADATVRQTCEQDSGLHDIVIHNGIAKARRRRDHDGHMVINDRQYDITHHPRWRTELRRDATVVAVLRRRFGPRPVLIRDATQDPTDRLALALTWFAVYPGRPGAISMAFEAF